MLIEMGLDQGLNVKQFLDLLAILRELESKNSKLPFVKLAKRHLLLASCDADLQLAESMLDRIGKFKRIPEGETEDGLVQLGLTMSMIILYGRATNGEKRDGGRGSSNIRDSLDPSLRPDHDFVIRVRNKSVAHVHVGNTSFDWHQQFFGLADFLDGAGARPFISNRSNNYNEEVEEKLRVLLPSARDIYKKRLEANSEPLFEATNDAIKSVNYRKFEKTALELVGTEEAVSAMFYTDEDVANGRV